MKIKNAWCLNKWPNHIVVRLQDGSYKMFLKSPIREITHSDLHAYKDRSKPDKNSGYHLSGNVLKQYGLGK